MPTRSVALSEEDYNAGAHQWLASRTMRTTTTVLGAGSAGAWLLGVACSIASWRNDTVLLPAGALLATAVLTGMPALMWLAGNLFRVIRIPAPTASLDPSSRHNRTINTVLFVVVRPTRWTIGAGLLIGAITAATLVVNAKLGAHQVEYRVLDGQHQSRALTTLQWSSVSTDGFRAARAADLRNNAAAILLLDTIAVMAMVGLGRWAAAESSAARADGRASAMPPHTRGAMPKKRST